MKERQCAHIESTDTENSETLSPLFGLLQNPIRNKQPSTENLFIGSIEVIGVGVIQLCTLDGQKITAVSLRQLTSDDIGKQCAFMFSEAMGNQAVIIGLLQHSVAAIEQSLPSKTAEQPLELNCPDGFRIQCGASSISLTPDGKVEIRGTRIINHASELHRIKAGSVRIN
jgi:hypothetical protein